MGSRLGMRLRARYSVFRASVRKNALLVDLVRQRWGVYWHENDLLMERGEGQMGNVGFTYMPYSDLGFARTWIEIPTRSQLLLVGRLHE